MTAKQGNERWNKKELMKCKTPVGVGIVGVHPIS